MKKEPATKSVHILHKHSEVSEYCGVMFMMVIAVILF